MQRAWIVSIGTELTLGQTVDTNAAWLAMRLAACGIRPERHVTVPDEMPPLLAVLAEASDRADLAIVTGGLGPTDDDLTRESLAQAANVPLELHAESLQQLEAFFASRGRTMPERNRSQAMMPRGATPIRNDWGTAPGVAIRIGSCQCFSLPGVPFEMKHMFAAGVEPLIRTASGGTVIRSRRLHCFGLGESEIGIRIADLMKRGRNPEVGTTAALGIIGVRINAAAPDATAADLLLDETESEVRSRLGSIVFGRDDDTLAAALGAMLVERGESLAVAESCTGGWIGKLLTDVAGSSRYFRGGFVSYANEAKQDLLGVDPALLERHGAVSREVALAMARGARERLGATFGLSVTGIAGPGGGSEAKPVGLVYIAWADARESRVGEHRFGDVPREIVRERAAYVALNVLRIELLGRSATATK